MKKIALLFAICCIFNQLKAQIVTIPIVSATNATVLQTDKDGHLRMVYCGKPLANQNEYADVYSAYKFTDGNAVGIGNSAYTPAGSNTLLEPAIQVTHANGDVSLDLKYVSHQTTVIDGNTNLISIMLKDPIYPFQVTLFYKVWKNENVTEQWAEIKHTEKAAVTLLKYASANLYFTDKDFYLTSFHGNWGHEMQPVDAKLEQGIYSVDTKLGSRAMLLQNNNCMVAFKHPATETEGYVMLGQIAWTGNFKMEFNVDSYNNLRLIAGINPFSSAYTLQPNQVFKTPSFIYTFSHHGKGEASRNLHNWLINNQLMDGKGERLTLLNNWEATFFDFDEQKLTGLFKDAKSLGVDMFLLDDGWFANKYPRNNDDAGLGDWQENVKKLPNGIGYLVKSAEKEGVKFGIWIEPEMVNPRSELYEKHLDWVIRQPDRPENYMRQQLVLDLSNPQVQDFVFGVVDTLFTKNPNLAFIKWDCNATIFNAYSAYLNKQKLPQSHLYVDYVRGWYNVLKRIRAKYPKVPMMLCSGGGGRADYEALKYFTEFWPSDNTEPLERVFIQWDYSYFFPAITSCNHVTDWGKEPIKYRVDVASMGKLGFDIVASKLNEKDRQFCQEAISNYNGFKDIVWHGNQYRLLNPHENKQASLMYVSGDKSHAVMFNYLSDFRYAPDARENPVPLQGLDLNKKYHVKELNIYPGSKSNFDENKVYSGDFLMNVGINVGISLGRMSVVIRVDEV